MSKLKIKIDPYRHNKTRAFYVVLIDLLEANSVMTKIMQLAIVFGPLRL